MPDAFNYIKNTGGIFLESGLPYKAEFAGCGSSGGLKIAQLSVSRYFSINRVNILFSQIIEKQSLCTGFFLMKQQSKILSTRREFLSVAVDASRWNSYMNGIYQDPIMSTQAPQYNHAVALVGYGNENGIPYYIIKKLMGCIVG